MKSIIFSIFVYFLSVPSISYAAPLNTDVTQKVRELYACYAFFDVGDLNKGNPFQGRTKEFSNLFITKAAALLVDVADRKTAQMLQEDGIDDYRIFSRHLQEVKESAERDKRLKKFSDFCTGMDDVKTEVTLPLAKDPDRFSKALGLYKCYSFFLKVSRSTQGEQSEKFRKLSNQLLLKTTQMVTPTDSEEQNMNLSKKVSEQGEAEIQAFLKNTLSLPVEERREKIGTYSESCVAMEKGTQ